MLLWAWPPPSETIALLSIYVLPCATVLPHVVSVPPLKYTPCLWDGISLIVKVWVASPPVMPPVYKSPAPNKNLSFNCSHAPPRNVCGFAELTDIYMLPVGYISSITSFALSPGSPASPFSPFKSAEDVPLAEVTVSVVPFQECVQDTPSVPAGPAAPGSPCGPRSASSCTSVKSAYVNESPLSPFAPCRGPLFSHPRWES